MPNILYFGDFIKNNGPSYVDLSLKIYLQDPNIYLQQANVKPSINLLKIFFKATNIHVSGVSFYGAIFLMFGRLFGKYCTYTMHGSLVKESQKRNISKYRLYIEKLLLVFSNKIVVVSSKMKQIVPYKQKTIVIPNGAKLTPNNNTYVKKNLITLIGGGRPEKQHLKVCQIIEKLISQGYNLSVNLFGEYGVDTDRIKQYDFINDYGFTSRSVLYKSLQQSKIFIQYSSWESFSLSIVDAMQYQCGVIASTNIGINDYIQPNSFYKIVDNELELAIVELLDQQKIYQTPKNSLLSWEKTAHKYLQLWTSYD